MKIAILEPYIAGTGGAQKVIEKYVLYLKARGHNVEIFAQRYEPDTAYEGFKKIKINILKPSSKNLSPFAFLFHKFKGFDRIIMNDFPSNFSSVLNKKTLWVCYSPRRYFYDLKDYYLENAKSFKEKLVLLTKIYLFEWLDQLSAKKAGKITVASKNVYNRVKKYYNREAEVIHHGIDTKKFYCEDYKDYFLCVSRLVKPKRMDVIVKSMGFVKDKSVKLYVVGSGEERKEMESLCKRYKNVVFLGEQSEKSLTKLYANCLGVVYVPINEDWGLVPLEAAASSKLTIGANEGGIKETVVSGKTGVLLESVSPEEIAKQIDFFAKNKKLAIKFGKAAKQHSSKFDWKVLLPKLEKFITAPFN